MTEVHCAWGIALRSFVRPSDRPSITFTMQMRWPSNVSVRRLVIFDINIHEAACVLRAITAHLRNYCDRSSDGFSVFEAATVSFIRWLDIWFYTSDWTMGNVPWLRPCSPTFRAYLPNGLCNALTVWLCRMCINDILEVEVLVKVPVTKSMIVVITDPWPARLCCTQRLVILHAQIY